jgi:hypothetical protein
VLLHHATEIAVRGSDDPGVDLRGLIRPDAADLALLDRSQDLPLMVRGEVADLVEE